MYGSALTHEMPVLQLWHALRLWNNFIVWNAYCIWSHFKCTEHLKCIYNTKLHCVVKLLMSPTEHHTFSRPTNFEGMSEVNFHDYRQQRLFYVWRIRRVKSLKTRHVIDIDQSNCKTLYSNNILIYNFAYYM